MSKFQGYVNVDEMIANAPCEQRVTLGGHTYLLRVETFLAQKPRYVSARYLVNGLDLGRSVVVGLLTSPQRDA